MVKKEFKTGLDVLFEPTIKKDGETIQNSREEKAIESNNNEVRATFIINIEQLNTLKALAYWERKQLKTLLGEVIGDYLSHIDEIELQKAKDGFSAKKNE